MLSKPKQISLFDFDKPAEVPQKKPSAQKQSTPQPVSEVVSADETPAVVELPDSFSPAAKKEQEEPSSPAKPAKVKAPDHQRKSTRGRKSIRELSAEAHLVNVPPDEELFQKSYYAIGKVAEMFRVNQSLLRLWENEFDILKPRKNGKGDRYFRPEDVKNIQLIYHLTRERKYTMEGAKEYFRNNKRADEKFALIESLNKIKSFLLELKANL